MKVSRSEFLDIRGRRLHVRLWGDERAPMLFLLHGWCDVSASWQFMVDAMSSDWRVVAPDWRGFGLSQWNNDVYWFPDYVADLDALAAALLADRSRCAWSDIAWAATLPASMPGFGPSVLHAWSIWKGLVCAVTSRTRRPNAT
jgi:pimeloyl-ACP methyl ester carboxylesterase